MREFYADKPIRRASILTNSYVEATIFWQDDNEQQEANNQVVLYVDLTLWSLTSAEIKIEFSNDWVTYYQDTFLAVSWTTATCSLWEYNLWASWRYRIAIPTKDRYIKVSAKGTWTVTWSSMAIVANMGTV